MGARRSMPSSARQRYFKRRLRRMGVLLTVALVLAVAVCSSLAYPVLAPDAKRGISQADTFKPTPESTRQPTAQPTVTVQETHPATTVPTVTEAATQVAVNPLPTQGQIVPPSADSHILYYTIAGDSLPEVGVRFGVDMASITSPDPLERKGLLPPGQLLIIPNKLQATETSSTHKLLPDSEVTFSPSTIDFDLHGFVQSAGGYLATYREYLASTGWTSGADVIGRVALEYSVNPRLLLAFLEFQSGWVYGFPDPADEIALTYPMGHVNSMKKNLYLQSAWFASRVMDGYYGWREGRQLVINFQDGQVLRLAPQLNAGSVGLMNAFSHLYGFQDWGILLYGEDMFLAHFERMFGDPWVRAQGVEPLIPVDTQQPEMILPFEKDKIWAFTGGPHAAWSAADVWAALDFAPASSITGCFDSSAWVVAAMSGRVIRSGAGVVVIDQDDDGYEQTGWTLLYLHIADKNRIARGEWVEIGDRIGHPSCEGGRSTGTHIHIARRYNGEWVPADGPLPFNLSGWRARAGTEAYKGWLIKGTDILYANTASTFETQIMRTE
jgi:LasA protease